MADGLIEPVMRVLCSMLVGVSLVVLRRGHRARGEVVAVSQSTQGWLI